MISPSLILDNSFSMYLVIDEDGGIQSQNKTFRDSYDHIKPRQVTDIIKDPGQYQSYLSAVEKAKVIYPTPCHCSFQIRQKNGASRWTYWSVFAYQKKVVLHGEHIYDINSIQQFDYEQIKAQLNELIWRYNHPVRQHTANILALVSLLRSAENIPQEVAENLEMIYGSAQELDHIVKKINDLSPKS